MTFVKVITVFFLIFFSFSPHAYADSKFSYDIDTDIVVNQSGNSNVVQKISLKNRTSEVYATKYALEVGSTSIQSPKAYDSNGHPLTLSTNTTDNATILALSFSDVVVGKGKTRDFTITYTNNDLSSLKGKVLELNIPTHKNLADIQNLSITTSIPKSFGQANHISVENYSYHQTDKFNIYTFDKSSLHQKGVNLIFGEKQVLNFTFNFYLENPTASQAITDVAIPPDSPYQKLYYNNFEPLPESIIEDPDGNWIATYKLEPNQSLHAITQGQVEIYSSPQVDYSQPEYDFDKHIQSAKFWHTLDPQIQDLANKYNTPEKIYDFLVSNFSYSYSRIDNQTTQRLGAKQAINSPQDVLCQEFTDAFIAIARAAGIPAREVNGFAFTQNPRLRPLSLVADVLHSWPEYYHPQKQTWVPIDPTWGNTTGGINYFDSWDLNHFAFVFHGVSSTKPYPPGYYKSVNKQGKDIIIDFDSNDPKQQIDLNFSPKIPLLTQIGLQNQLLLQVTNNSNIAFQNLPLQIYLQNDQIASAKLDSLIPLNTTSHSVKLTTKLPIGDKITIKNSDYNLDLSVTVNNKNPIYVPLAVLVLTIIGSTILTWSLLVPRRKR